MFPDWGKRRLYLAFYYRGTPAKGYHVALLLTPKNPSKSTEAVAWRFHVKNVIENVDGTPKQVWIYEGAPTKTRSDRLSGLVFLSKIPSGVSGEKLNEVLKTVEVKQDDPEWRCKDWVIAAIQLLSDKRVAQSLSTLRHPPKEMQEAVLKVIQDERPNFAPEKPVFTCDANGKQIKSEVT